MTGKAWMALNTVRNMGGEDSEWSKEHGNTKQNKEALRYLREHLNDCEQAVRNMDIKKTAGEA